MTVDYRIDPRASGTAIVQNVPPGQTQYGSLTDWGRAAAVAQGDWAYTLHEHGVDRLEESLERKFQRLADEWHRETRYLSSDDDIAMHPAYQQIIGLGDRALPLILRALQRRLDHW